MSAVDDELRKLDWYHRIELPGGRVTPGAHGPKELSKLHLPTSFAGKSVLDIGAWDGFYSFEAAKRGASRVLATDSYVWQSRWTQQGFNLARRELGFEGIVEDQVIDVMDLSPDAVGGRFDVVLFLGVLYHLVDPVRGLERAASVCDKLLVLETETALNYLPFPAARLWPTSELARDKTNWWSINARGLIRLLESFGFDDIRIVYRTPGYRRIARAAFKNKWGSGFERFRRGLRSERIVIHALRSHGSAVTPS